MKSNNPDKLLTYLVFNEVFCWGVTVGLFLFLNRNTSNRALSYGLIGLSLLLGSVLMLLFFVCNKDLLFQSPPRAVLAAATTPVILSTKISRVALIFYLLNRIFFTDLPVALVGMMLVESDPRAGWVLQVYGYCCAAVLLAQACLLIFWEVKSLLDEHGE
jgi:hypothetical protein